MSLESNWIEVTGKRTDWTWRKTYRENHPIQVSTPQPVEANLTYEPPKAEAPDSKDPNTLIFVNSINVLLLKADGSYSGISVVLSDQRLLIAIYLKRI